MWGDTYYVEVVLADQGEYGAVGRYHLCGHMYYVYMIPPTKMYSGSNNCPNVCMFFTKVDNP